MQVDDPPYLSVGTAVSAKYKGAFCEAKVSKVDRMVKCKITYRMGLGTTTVTDNEIKGTLRVGQLVQVKHPDRKDLVDAIITKIQDCSQYTVVFDDGDITTLRRSALCLKSGRHFNESETLDQLPLTHPEHFGNPVMGGRRGRRNRQLKDESSDEEIEEENEPDLEGYSQDIGRVVSIDTGENKRGKEKWFPGLIVIPSAQPTVKINVKDEFLIRSFRDDRYYTVPKKEVNEFNRELAERVESAGLQEAIQKAIKFLDHNELPLHWEKSSLFNISADSDSYDNASDTSEEEQSEEKDRFVAQLYKFMDDSGTPLNKTPAISNKDIDLHRLFRVVQKWGGYNRVTNQNKWKSVTAKMRLSVNQNISNQVKSVYKKCLSSYEAFHRTLGVTMFNPTRSKKNKGRSLIRDKDRTPMSSPRPEREEEGGDKFVHKKEVPVPEKVDIKSKKKTEPKEKEDNNKKIKATEVTETSSDLLDAASTSTNRPKRNEAKIVKDKNLKQMPPDRVKVVVERFEDLVKKDEKIQHTRSKAITIVKPKEPPKETITTRQNKEPITPVKPVPKPVKKVIPKEEEDKDKKPKQRKKLTTDSTSSESSSASEPSLTANIGDKLIIYYGPTNESKVTYEAKVVDIDKDVSGPIYLVHYTGWNTRYDEWIPGARIAENVSSGVKTKRSKVPLVANVKPGLSAGPSSATKQAVMKRSRVMSVSSRAPPDEKPPRSTTPSSVTSSSSRTKSPATPATRSGRLAARQESSKKRRTSAQTDASVQSDTDSDISESETELPRTRSGSTKLEEPEVKIYRKKITKPPVALSPVKAEKRKDSTKEDDDTEKEEDCEKTPKEKRLKRIKKSSEKSADESDEDGFNHAKGRDFDLNQIRSELKGFTKAIKVSAVEIEKDSISSSDDSSSNVNIMVTEEKEEIKIEEPKAKQTPPRQSPKLEQSSSSEDIYEFKEPEPFEFESRSKLVDDKLVKKRLPRIFEEFDKSPKKKGGKSPSTSERNEKLDLPEPKTYSRMPKNIHISDDDDDDDDGDDEDGNITEEEAPTIEDKKEDPFDKLIESPSFNIIKTSPEKPIIDKPGPSNLLYDSLSLFRELPETSDEYSRDMELSDCESQTQIFTRADTLFTNTFVKSSSERNTPDLEFSSSKTDEGKTTNSDDDDIQAQIQRVIAQNSSTDDDSNDTMLSISAPITGPLVQSEEVKKPTSSLRISTIPSTNKEPIVPLVPIAKESITSIAKQELDIPKPESPKELKPPSPKKPIDPALQETDSSLLESIVSKPPLILNSKLDDTCKELIVKTGTKIADSILQKFNFIKNNFETKTYKSEPSTSTSLEIPTGSSCIVDKLDTKPITAFTKGEKDQEPLTSNIDTKSRLSIEVKPNVDVKPKEEKSIETPTKPGEIKPKGESPKQSNVKIDPLDSKRRKRVISKAYIDESDSDSSDSEHLVIARSDDDSQTNSSDNKPLIECKENTDSNISLQKTITTDDSQSQLEEEQRSFNFDDIPLKKDNEENPKQELDPVKSVEIPSEKETKQEDIKEENDPGLQSLLLCEEEIPRSPASAPEIPNPADIPSSSAVHEMPFASAPGTSNCKMLIEQKKILAPVLVMPIERENRSDAQVVIENTPPTTPESTLSNLSPRADNGNISPNSNDSSKSNEPEPDFRNDRRSSAIKVSAYSEEDTQIGDLSPIKKPSPDPCGPPASCRKRRRSLRTSEDSSSMSHIPVKRGRKPLATRPRRDSDSDDASENSAPGSGGGNTPGSSSSLYDRPSRSPRPSRYNFFVEFEPGLDSGQRIAVLQQKLCELRKTYADVKAELAAVERRRKKIRRREREALKTAKQEMACA